MKPLKVVVLVISALVLSACGTRNRSLNNDTPSIPGVSVPSEHSAFSGAIGPSGGEVKDPENNLNIVIPSGALSSETNISATYIEAPEILSNKISADFLGAVEFGPSGTVFAKPVTVTINLNKTPKSNSLAVFCYSPQDDVWEYVTDATPNGNKATFEVTHFSTYQVKNRTRDFYDEYTNIANHGQVNGLSDAEIIEAFRDYLVNDKHVMDQYTTYDGYWYEPCGLKIFGQYQINGKLGDPEALSIVEGESNKVGDAYGLSIVDGAISNKQGVKAASSSSEAYDVTVIVEYKIIKPDIDLIASKKKLKKGESATISIRCHYTNAKNFYPEYKDLDLAGYMLTIAKPTHFSVDKSVVLTNGGGRASFVATALENDKAETITVNFDVSGNFGTHAEGNITLNSVGISISGHIKEEKHMSYKIPIDESVGYELLQLGSFDFVAEYDFEGMIKTDDGEESSSLTISNISVSFSSVANILRRESGSSVHTATYDAFSTIKNVNPHPTSFEVSAVEDEGVISLVAGVESTIATLDGEGGVTSVITAQGETVTDTTPDSFVITLSNKNKLLLDFVPIEGSETYYSSSLVDNFDITANYRGDIVKFEDWNFKILTDSEETTQTITVS